MKVINIVQTCSACPSQWNAQTESGRSVYVRYRWGRLTAEVSKEIGTFEYTNLGHTWCLVVDERLGHSLDGVISWEEVEPYINEVVLLEECGFD